MGGILGDAGAACLSNVRSHAGYPLMHIKILNLLVALRQINRKSPTAPSLNKHIFPIQT